ncbi:MAG TPA: adenylate/guanylate cyclase domain-containing protein [Gammaproteobacteria bacterium]|nr:adenylate/guanylate cyclase domain-containing protein [Gammaproteobacteria bacterium]
MILHADVVGSTLLVQRDEQRAHQRIQDAFRRFGLTITDYHGRVRELRGDALLAEFERASDAVSAALAFQSAQSRQTAEYDDDIRPALRVGVALGEVIIADNTITGEGVVLAQRLEQLAEPGGLCITPAIREALPKRLPFDLESLGGRELKGFEDSIEIFRVHLKSGAILPAPGEIATRRDARAPARSATGLVLALLVALGLAGAGYLAWLQRSDLARDESAQPQAGERPSIAVLPFDNLSGDPQQDYFADGITEDLTTDLSHVSGLFVVARNSSFAYKGRSVDLRTVAAELGVRYVLEGSVRQVGGQIRINAQLIDAHSGGHVWANRFDGAIADVFALQDEVNHNIISALEVRLTEDEEARMGRVETTVPEAYDVLLRGVERYNTFTRESNLEARQLFERAARIDPNYARAYANIALTYATEVNFFAPDDRAEAVRKGLEYARKAVELDDGIPQIYLTRSILYLSQRQHAAALEAAKRTIEVHPDYADGHATLGFISSYTGDYEQALAALARAREINPQGTGVYLAIEGRVLFLTKRYQDALPRLLESAARNPGFDVTQLALAAVYARLGRPDDAAWSIDEALAISPELSLTQLRRDSLYRDSADLDDWLDALREAGLPE